MTAMNKHLWTRVLFVVLTFGWSMAFGTMKSLVPKQPFPTTTTTTTTTTTISSNPNAILAGISTAFVSSVPAVLALEDDVELAELPPPIVPLVFAVALIVGVGLLTSSLGDVYSEEAALGLQSGAQAKKERERSRSSYFKKR